MSVEARVTSLTQRHAVVDRELAAESNRPLPDISTVAKLKREKLRLKDEVERLAHH